MVLGGLEWVNERECGRNDAWNRFSHDDATDRSDPLELKTPRYQRKQTCGENGRAGSRFLVQVGVVLNANIGKPTGPDTGEG